MEARINYLFYLHIIISKAISLVRQIINPISPLYRKKDSPFKNNVFQFPSLPYCGYCKSNESPTYPIQLVIKIAMTKKKISDDNIMTLLD